MRSGGDCDETLDELAEVILNVLLYGAQCGSYLTPFRPRPPRVPLGEGGGGQKLARTMFSRGIVTGCSLMTMSLEWHRLAAIDLSKRECWEEDDIEGRGGEPLYLR